MTDYPTDTPEELSEPCTRITYYEPDDISEPLLTPEDNALITATVSLISRTISAKALEAALLVGDYILTHFFDGDIESAFSKDPDKPVSFTALCQHPDLRLSRTKLVNMLKVAAQQRFLGEGEVDFAALHYSHLEKLTQLPNDEIKLDLVQKCVDDDLTTRQLGYHIRMRKIEMQETESGEGEPEKPGPLEIIEMSVAPALEQLAGQVNALNLEAAYGIVAYLHPETRGLLQNRLMTLIDALNGAETNCADLLSQLEPDEGNH